MADLIPFLLGIEHFKVLNYLMYLKCYDKKQEASRHLTDLILTFSYLGSWPAYVTPVGSGGAVKGDTITSPSFGMILDSSRVSNG